MIYRLIEYCLLCSSFDCVDQSGKSVFNQIIEQFSSSVPFEVSSYDDNGLSLIDVLCRDHFCFWGISFKVE